MLISVICFHKLMIHISKLTQWPYILSPGSWRAEFRYYEITLSVNAVPHGFDSCLFSCSRPLLDCKIEYLWQMRTHEIFSLPLLWGFILLFSLVWSERNIDWKSMFLLIINKKIIILLYEINLFFKPVNKIVSQSVAMYYSIEVEFPYL